MHDKNATQTPAQINATQTPAQIFLEQLNENQEESIAGGSLALFPLVIWDRPINAGDLIGFGPPGGLIGYNSPALD